MTSHLDLQMQTLRVGVVVHTVWPLSDIITDATNFMRGQSGSGDEWVLVITDDPIYYRL
jgi:hypothetical protein